MKTRLMLLPSIASAILLTMLTSCMKDCYTCTFQPYSVQSFCREDFETQEQFEATLNYYKAYNYTCK